MDAEFLERLSVDLEPSAFEPSEMCLADSYLAMLELRHLYDGFRRLGSWLTGEGLLEARRAVRKTPLFNHRQSDVLESLFDWDMSRALDVELGQYLERRDDVIRALVELHVAHEALPWRGSGYVFKEYRDRELGCLDSSVIGKRDSKPIFSGKTRLARYIRSELAEVEAEVELEQFYKSVMMGLCRARGRYVIDCSEEAYDPKYACADLEEVCATWEVLGCKIWDVLTSVGFEPVEGGLSRSFQFRGAWVTHFVSIQQTHVFSLASITKSSGDKGLDDEIEDALIFEQDQLSKYGLPVLKDFRTSDYKRDFKRFLRRDGKRFRYNGWKLFKYTDGGRFLEIDGVEHLVMNFGASGYTRRHSSVGSFENLAFDLADLRVFVESRGLPVAIYGDVSWLERSPGALEELSKFKNFKGAIPFKARLWLEEELCYDWSGFVDNEFVELLIQGGLTRAETSCVIYRDTSGKYRKLAEEYGLRVELKLPESLPGESDECAHLRHWIVGEYGLDVSYVDGDLVFGGMLLKRSEDGEWIAHEHGSGKVLRKVGRGPTEVESTLHQSPLMMQRLCRSSLMSCTSAQGMVRPTKSRV